MVLRGRCDDGDDLCRTSCDFEAVAGTGEDSRGNRSGSGDQGRACGRSGDGGRWLHAERLQIRRLGHGARPSGRLVASCWETPLPLFFATSDCRCDRLVAGAAKHHSCCRCHVSTLLYCYRSSVTAPPHSLTHSQAAAGPLAAAAGERSFLPVQRCSRVRDHCTATRTVRSSAPTPALSRTLPSLPEPGWRSPGSRTPVLSLLKSGVKCR